MTEKLGVDPPPSPTTPASYIQLFCNLRQVQHCGTTYRNKHVSYNTHVFLIKITPWLTFFFGFLPEMVISREKSGQITFKDRALGKADLFFFLYLTHNVDQSFQIKTHSVYIVVHAIVWNVSKLLLLFHVATFLDISFSSSFLCRCERNFKTEM